MNQLDYQPVFPSGSFFHNKQPLSESSYQQQAPVQQGQQQEQLQSQPQGQQQHEQPQRQPQGQQQEQLQRQPQGQQQQLPEVQQQQQHIQSVPQQQQQHQLQLHQQQHGMYNSNASNVQPVGRFTSAPYTQAMQTGAINAAQQQAALRHSASPHQPNSPFTTGTPQPQQPQIKYPMAAPPLPNTPSSTPQSVPATLPVISAPPTPHSPNIQHIEQSRIKLLFEINVDLIQEISSLQEQGRGGATSPQHQMQLKSMNMDDKMASEEYIQTMRRVQANLAYLAPRGNLPGQHQKSLPGPAHMTPPHQMPQLQVKYDHLRELFPGWAGIDLAMQYGNFNSHPGIAGTNRTSA